MREENGIELARAFRPEVVFLDIGMPGKNGYEVARALRLTPGVERAVLVALTGWGAESDRTRSHKAGFDQHLSKPIDPNLVKELVEKAGHKLRSRVG